MANLLKKITVKHVAPNFSAPGVGEEKQICIVMGYAKSADLKVTTFGESTAFHGDFQAINTETGESYRAGTCYLPDVAASLLKSAVEGAEGNVVEFGFEIGVVGVKGRTPEETGKYEYRCKPLMKASENDPMEQLTEKLKHGLLASPKTAPKQKGDKK